MTRFSFMCAGFLASCSTLVPAPDVDLTGLDPHSAWARTLAENVDAQGAIDFEGLGDHPEDLNIYVAWIAQERAPALTGAEELAYWINAYNALAMYNVLHAGVAPKAKVRFFYLRQLEQDGGRTSLYDFENDVIRKRGEPRVHFALNCMVRSCPRLPRSPFLAANLDEQLEEAAARFLNDPRHVQLVAERETVRLSSILDWYEEDFTAAAPSLIAYVNGYREEPIPVGWRVEFLPYDWTLNQRP